MKSTLCHSIDGLATTLGNKRPRVHTGRHPAIVVLKVAALTATLHEVHLTDHDAPRRVIATADPASSDQRCSVTVA
jgi:hypothetical protein